MWALVLNHSLLPWPCGGE